MRDRPAALEVVLHGIVVATLNERPRRSNVIDLTYTDAALSRWPLRSPVLSCSLPLAAGRQDATAFLDGLLPEGPTRDTLAAQRGLVAGDTWGLIAAFGRDVAGAAVIRDPEVPAADRGQGVEVYATDRDLESAIDALPDQPLGVHDDSELSLAGVQEKLLLVAVDDGCGWARPTGGTASTHILKPDSLAHPGVVVREAEALRIAQRSGLTSINPTLVDLGGRPCLVVDRYDRTAGPPVMRVHQEDLCQAAGIDARARHGRAKYEERGGPGWKVAAALLRDRAADPDRELAQLVGAMVFTVLIGNSDAHAKNLSFVLDPPGTIALAPLYDTVPTMLFPKLKVRCAMWVGLVNGSLEDVDVTAMVREVAGRDGWRIPEPAARELIGSWIDTIVGAADGDDPTAAYVRDRAARLR